MKFMHFGTKKMNSKCRFLNSVYSKDCKIKKVEAKGFVLVLLSSTCETFVKTFIILRKLIFQNVITLKDHKITNGGHQLL